MRDTNDLNDTLGELEEELRSIKSASELISSAKLTAERTVEEAKRTMIELLRQSKDSTDGVIRESKRLQETTTESLKVSSLLIKKLDKVDFPTRLDKLDIAVSSLNVSIQNMFGRLAGIEKNIKDDFNFKIQLMQERIIEQEKVNKYLLVGLIFIGVVNIFTVIMLNR